MPWNDPAERMKWLVRLRKMPGFTEFVGKYPEPKHSALIEFTFDGFGGDGQYRCYEVQRAEHKNGFRSYMSGGQEHWTDKGEGYSGEPITSYREWVVVEGNGYIGSFLYWEEVLGFIFYNLRGKVSGFVSD